MDISGTSLERKPQAPQTPGEGGEIFEGANAQQCPAASPQGSDWISLLSNSYCFFLGLLPSPGCVSVHLPQFPHLLERAQWHSPPGAAGESEMCVEG